MRAAALAAVMLLVAAPSRAADAKASPASIGKLQKLASRVRGLKKGLTVVPKSKVASKIAAKASKASKPAALPSNKISRVTALRSLYRQMAALDYRACNVANLPKVSQLKAKAGLRRLAMMGERAGLDDADLDDPDADADLAQQCNACPSGTVAAGDDTYGLCYCADPADLAAANAAVSSNTADISMDSSVDASSMAASVAVSSAPDTSVDSGAAPDVDATLASLSRFEKIANKNLSEKATPKALPHSKLPAVAEWHYQRAQVYEGMAVAATKPAFAPAKLGKDGRPQLAGVQTSSQLRKLAARLSSGQGPVAMSRPLAKGGYAVTVMPRSMAVRNTYATMAAADLRAARIAGLPNVEADAAKLMADSLVNLMAGGRIARKAHKAGKKAGRKAGARIADDEGDGGDSGGGEVDMGVEPVVYVDNGGGDSGGGDSASYSDPFSGASSTDSGASYADSGDAGAGYADSGDAGDSGASYADPGDSGDAGASYADSGSADSSADAFAFGGADDTSGADLSGGDATSATPDGGDNGAWAAGDLDGSNENAVNDSFNGTALTDQGDQDPAPDASQWGDLTGSEENAVASNDDSGQAPADAAAAGGDDVGPDNLQDAPNDPAAAASDQAPTDNADAVAAAGQDNGTPSTDELDPNAGQQCSEDDAGGGFQHKVSGRKAGIIAYCKKKIHDWLYPPQTPPQSPYVTPPQAPTPENTWTAPGTVLETDPTHTPEWYQAQGFPCVPGTPGAMICQTDKGSFTVKIPAPYSTNPLPKSRIVMSRVACPAKSRSVYSRKAGMTVCSLPTKAGKVAAGRKAGKPLYSRLARLNTAALKASRGLADRQTPRAKKALLLYQRGQAYAHMALAVAAPPRARRASKVHAKQADKVASKAKSAAKPAKPVVSDDVSTPAPAPEQAAPAPQPAPQPAPAAQPPAPAAPSAEDVMKQDMKDMDDMGKDMENQIRQRSGH